jgi:hypothetical protein
MKTNNRELKGAYRSYIRSRPGAGRKSCPAPEEIWHLLWRKGHRKQKARLIDHISDCSACYGEFEAFLEIRRAEGRLIDNIKESLKGRFEKPPHSWNWRYASALIILVAVAASVIFSTRWLGLTKKHEERGKLSRQLRLIAPGSNRTLRAPLVFEWEGIPTAEYYIVEIFDSSLLTFWKSPATSQNFFAIPLPIEKRMRRNTRYFWMLTAFQRDGTKTESSLEEFELID